MNLRSVDLNLLVILEALIAEKHVTRAAERVNLSQPAVSGALRRLRAIFQDELLVRTPRGMDPTPRALELAGQIGPLLRKVERVFESELDFDPLTTRRAVAIRMSDLMASLLLPRLTSDLMTYAPHLNIRIVNLSPADTIKALMDEEIDFAFSTGLVHPGIIVSETLFDDRLVCVLRRKHALRGSLMKIDDFLSLRHLKISSSPADSRFVDHLLLMQNLERDVAVNLPYWMLAPDVIANTDLALVIPASLARKFDDARLKVMQMPFASGAFEWRLYWNKRHQHTQAHQWLRAELAKSASRDA